MKNLSVAMSDGPTVLIVEDDDALRVLFRALLSRRGFAVEEARNGLEALKLLEVRSFDAIILDLMMPVCTGFEVLKEFAASRPELLSRTIVSSGINERQLEKIDREAVFGLIRKPFDIEHLVQTISDCVSQPRAAAPAADLSSLYEAACERFAKKAPALRRVLRVPPTSAEELMLRAELRRVVDELRNVFAQVAANDASAGFAELADLAADIAQAPAEPASRGVAHGH